MMEMKSVCLTYKKRRADRVSLTKPIRHGHISGAAFTCSRDVIEVYIVDGLSNIGRNPSCFKNIVMQEMLF